MNAILFSAIWGIGMMFAGIFLKSPRAIRMAAILGAALLLAVNIADIMGKHFFSIDNHNMLDFEAFGLVFNCIAFGSTLIYFLLSGKDIEKVGAHGAEYFALIFFVLCGVSISTTFNSLLMLFLGIETMSIPLYILTGSEKRNLKGNEASLKYFLMGAFSTGLLLLGIAFLYGASEKGTFFIDELGVGKGLVSPLYIVGLLLVLVAMSFKVSAVPFHFWTPDVYDGAPTVFTSFMATIVKAASFIAFIRLFGDAFQDIQPQWQQFVALITAATLFIGNLTAVFQQSVKRMLAYSSIAQAGFMLMALLTLNTFATEGIILYSAAYCLSTIGLFSVLTRMKDHSFEGFNGLARTQPVLAAVCTIFLLSLTGIPLTAGFLAKYYMLAAVLQSGKFLWLVIFAVLCAAVSAYYYFRLIQAMYFKSGEAQALDITWEFKTLLILVAGMTVLLGVFPQWLTDRLYFIYL
jgi:NADH-quinone oxidoreductase subunit N